MVVNVPVKMPVEVEYVRLRLLELDDPLVAQVVVVHDVDVAWPDTLG